MMGTCKVAIGMLTRNSASTLPTVLDALLRLRPQPDLYVFLDALSDDGSYGLLKDFAAAKEVWSFNDIDDNFGRRVAAARQALLEHVRLLNPEWMVWVDSDVLIQSQNAIERLTTCPNADLVAGAYKMAPSAYVIQLYRPPSTVRPLLAGELPAGCFQTLNVQSSTIRNLPLHPFGLWTVTGAGGGCLAVSRRVIQDRNVNFYRYPTVGKPRTCDIAERLEDGATISGLTVP
jgi:glycosyltransferase involved in cell wall biosynthesis